MVTWSPPSQAGGIATWGPASAEGPNNHASCAATNWSSSGDPLVASCAIRFIPLQRTRPPPTCQRAATTRFPTRTSSVAPCFTELALLAPQPPLPYTKRPNCGSPAPSTCTRSDASSALHRTDATGNTAGAEPRSQSGSTYCQPVSMNRCPPPRTYRSRRDQAVPWSRY